LELNPQIGLISPLLTDYVSPERFSWLGNHSSRQELELRGLPFVSAETRFDYPAGGMFIARTKAIQQLFSEDWSFSDFPPELGQLDGEIQHAIERYVGYLCRQNEYLSAYFDSKTGRFTVDNSFLKAKRTLRPWLGLIRSRGTS
jgi:lipopolysaccharide biosynthesis protein